MRIKGYVGFHAVSILIIITFESRTKIEQGITEQTKEENDGKI